MTLIVPMADHVDHDGTGEDQNVVFTFDNVHTIGIGPGKPALRDLCHLPITASEFVAVISKVPFGFKILGTGNVDRESAMEKADQFLFHDREQIAVTVDLVGRSPGEKLLANESQFLARHGLEGEFVAKAKGFSIDKKCVLSVCCFNGEIVAPGKQFLLHHVAHNESAFELREDWH